MRIQIRGVMDQLLRSGSPWKDPSPLAGESSEGLELMDALLPSPNPSPKSEGELVV